MASVWPSSEPQAPASLLSPHCFNFLASRTLASSPSAETTSMPPTSPIFANTSLSLARTPTSSTPPSRRTSHMGTPLYPPQISDERPRPQMYTISLCHYHTVTIPWLARTHPSSPAVKLSDYKLLVLWLGRRRSSF